MHAICDEHTESMYIHAKLYVYERARARKEKSVKENRYEGVQTRVENWESERENNKKYRKK